MASPRGVTRPTTMLSVGRVTRPGAKDSAQAILSSVMLNSYIYSLTDNVPGKTVTEQSCHNVDEENNNQQDQGGGICSILNIRD